MPRALPAAARTLNDVGLAAWFGGSLARAGRPGPMSLAAMAAHALGAVYLTVDNRARLAGQRGVASVAAVKGALTLAAMGATLWAWRGTAAGPAERAQGDGAPDAAGPPAALRWAIPALTGAAMTANAVLGEQQRPREVARGVLGRIARRIANS